MDFTSNFWNDFPGVFSGCSILLTKMKVSSTATDQYASFVKSLSCAIDDFGRSIHKASKTNPLEGEPGYLMEVGQAIANSLMLLGQQARDAAKAMQEQAAKAEMLSTNLNNVRQECKEALREPQNQVTECLKKMNTAKKIAQVRLQEKIECEKQTACVLWNQNAKQRDKDRASNSQEKTRNAWDDSETVYKNSVPFLNDAIDVFIQIAEKEFLKLEKSEHERYRIIRENIWGVTNIVSQLAVMLDDRRELNLDREDGRVEKVETNKKTVAAQMIELVGKPEKEFLMGMKCIRISLEKLNVNKDIGSWIAKNKTGQSKPSHVMYIASSQATAVGDDPDYIICAVDYDEEKYEGNSKLVSIRSGRALHSYKPRRVSEISLESGDLLDILNESHRDWVLVRRKRGGNKEGFVPANYIEACREIPTKEVPKKCLIADLKEKVSNIKFK